MKAILGDRYGAPELLERREGRQARDRGHRRRERNWQAECRKTVPVMTRSLGFRS
jgi:hypothetical protein